jgi:hypothetical protein
MVASWWPKIHGLVCECMSLDTTALLKKGGYLESKQIKINDMNSCHWNGDDEFKG